MSTNVKRTNPVRTAHGDPQRRGSAQRPVPTRQAAQNAHVSHTRTGSAPYLYGQHTQRRPVPRKRREPLYIIILRWFYIHRRTAALTLGIFLFACITIPLVAYAASSAGGSDAPDFEILDTSPESTDIISASLSGSAFDASIPGTSAENKEDEPQSEEKTDESTNSAPETQTEETAEEQSDTNEPEPGEAEDMTDSTGAADNNSAEPTESSTEVEIITESVEVIPETPEEEIVSEFPVTIGFYDREAISCLTGPATLREILATVGYTLRDTDRPSISLDEYIEGESWIMIDTVTYEAVTESEAIPFEVETYEVQTVPRGTTQTVTYGVNGSLDKVYTIEYVNGVEANRTFEYEYISSYPTNQVDYYGTGGTFYAPDGTLYSYSYYVNVRATYYNIYGNTASGMPTGNNVMAVDPSVFPLGTQVYVMNDYYDMGVKTAADTGGAIKGNIIDIWMDENHPYYYQFTAQGVCDMIAYVLD